MKTIIADTNVQTLTCILFLLLHIGTCKGASFLTEWNLTSALSVFLPCSWLWGDPLGQWVWQEDRDQWWVFGGIYLFRFVAYAYICNLKRHIYVYVLHQPCRKCKSRSYIVSCCVYILCICQNLMTCFESFALWLSGHTALSVWYHQLPRKSDSVVAPVFLFFFFSWACWYTIHYLSPGKDPTKNCPLLNLLFSG